MNTNYDSAAQDSPFEIKRRERLTTIKKLYEAQRLRQELLKQAKRGRTKLVHITPRAHALLEKFYLTCPLAKQEFVSLAIMELIERKLTNSELAGLWEKHRAPAPPQMLHAAPLPECETAGVSS